VDTIRLFHDQLICKSPGFEDRTAAGWHVDAAYWQTCTSPRMLTAWIPLTSYDKNMGPIAVIPRSHRWPSHDWMTTFNEQNLAALERKIQSSGAVMEVKPILIAPGQVSFHHASTIHGSLPNRGCRPRLALTVHAQAGDNAYRRHVDCRGRLATHVNDALCRRTPAGYPDYSDPDICPVLWPRGPTDSAQDEPK
jgi:ectoine hydroxylase-related dioxygenase (phytanoyl-CoA dioxygenase family)